MDTVLTDLQREMVLANVPLVEHIVNRVGAGLPSIYSRDDLVQSGIMGLIAATVRFDPSAGAAFSTYAGRRIEGAIIDSLRKSDWAPRSVRSLERRLGEAQARTGPSDASDLSKMADELGIDEAELSKLRADIARSRLESLDRPTSGDDSAAIALADTLHDNRALTEEVLDDQELTGYLRDGVAVLPERHRIVIVGFFFEGRTMTDLGALLGVTQSRASQIKEEALQLLRNGLLDVYRGDAPGDEPPEGSGRRQQSFSDSMADYRSWRDRLEAGKGFTASG